MRSRAFSVHWSPGFGVTNWVEMERNLRSRRGQGVGDASPRAGRAAPNRQNASTDAMPSGSATQKTDLVRIPFQNL